MKAFWGCCLLLGGVLTVSAGGQCAGETAAASAAAPMAQDAPAATGTPVPGATDKVSLRLNLKPGARYYSRMDTVSDDTLAIGPYPSMGHIRVEAGCEFRVLGVTATGETHIAFKIDSFSLAFALGTHTLVVDTAHPSHEKPGASLSDSKDWSSMAHALVGQEIKLRLSPSGAVESRDGWSAAVYRAIRANHSATPAAERRVIAERLWNFTGFGGGTGSLPLMAQAQLPLPATDVGVTDTWATAQVWPADYRLSRYAVQENDDYRATGRRDGRLYVGAEGYLHTIQAPVKGKAEGWPDVQFWTKSTGSLKIDEKTGLTAGSQMKVRSKEQSVVWLAGKLLASSRYSRSQMHFQCWFDVAPAGR